MDNNITTTKTLFLLPPQLILQLIMWQVKDTAVYKVLNFQDFFCISLFCSNIYFVAWYTLFPSKLCWRKSWPIWILTFGKSDHPPPLYNIELHLVPFSS